MSKRNIYFGSLEDQLEVSKTDTELTTQPQTQIETNFITPNYDSVKREDMGQGTSAASAEFDRRNVAKTLKIPTDDASVRKLLISLNQPITLFGEGPAERRDRLRLMASKAICSLPKAFELFPFLRNLMPGEPQGSSPGITGDSDNEDDIEEEFYVPGTLDLIKVRSFILEDSINRAKSRRKTIDHVIEHAKRTSLYEKLGKELDLKATFMDPQGRPLSTCTFTQNGDLYTGDWSGRIIKYSNETGRSELISSSGDRITAMCQDRGDSSDQQVLFGTAIGKIEFGNAYKLSLPTSHAIKSLNWHPSSRFFASTSADSLWRLWDASEGRELQVQEGHLGGASGGAWHPDGALYATGGTVDGLIRIWDCRMGKSIWTIPPSNQSQSIAITSLTFSPQSSHILASSNSDGLISFHDLRKVEAEYLKTAAHRSCCTGLKFASGGKVLASSGFDGSVRFWCPGDLRLIKDLPVTGSKVTAFDIIESGPSLKSELNIKLAAVTFDRSVKIFHV